MLIKEPFKRPSIRMILEKDFLVEWISQLLSNTIAKHEFSNTFLSKHVNYEDKEDSKSTNENASEDWKTAWAEKKEDAVLGDDEVKQ
jgi:hypothetical protein